MTCLVVGGTIGFALIEGWTIEDAFFMTMITISTVGYSETHELTHNGRLFATSLISVSIVLMACWTAGVTSFLVNGQLTGDFYRRGAKKRAHQMTGHTVVCGGGAAARTLMQKLSMVEKEIVAIVLDPDEVTMTRQCFPNVPLIQADPKSEMAMIEANILGASHLVAATESDFDNLLIVITGKGIGTAIKVISVAQNPEIANRMLKVGADDVVCPLVIGGEKMASLITGANTPIRNLQPV